MFCARMKTILIIPGTFSCFSSQEDIDKRSVYKFYKKSFFFPHKKGLHKYKISYSINIYLVKSRNEKNTFRTRGCSHRENLISHLLFSITNQFGLFNFLLHIEPKPTGTKIRLDLAFNAQCVLCSV